MTYVAAKDNEIDSMLRDHPLISPGSNTTTVASPFFGGNDNQNQSTLKTNNKNAALKSSNTPKKAQFKITVPDSIPEDDSLENLIESAMKAADAKIAENELENTAPPVSTKPVQSSFKDELDAFKSKIQTFPQNISNLNHSYSVNSLSHSSEPRPLNHSASSALLKSSKSRQTLQKSASMSLIDSRPIEKVIVPSGGLNKKIISKMNDTQASIALKLNALLDNITRN